MLLFPFTDSENIPKFSEFMGLVVMWEVFSGGKICRKKLLEHDDVGLKRL